MRGDIPSLHCTPTTNSRLMHCGMRTKMENVRKISEYRQLYRRVLYTMCSVCVPSAMVHIIPWRESIQSLQDE